MLSRAGVAGDERAHLVREFLARAVIIVLFTFLSINLLSDFERTRRLTDLLLLVSEALVIVLTLVRRRASPTNRSLSENAITVISLVGPPLLRASGSPGLLPDSLTAAISTIGVALVIVGKITLGRSFGIAPANRGVVASGPYNLVRHPIYSGYLVTHLGFVLANPRTWNIAVALISDIALIARALVEEQVLARDAAYQAYCQRVGWHLVPGVF